MEQYKQNPLPKDTKQAQIDANLQVYSDTPDDQIWANNPGFSTTPRFAIGGTRPTGPTPGLGISTDAHHLKEYSIAGAGAPNQRFYYAGLGRPAGVRAQPHSNLAMAPRGLGDSHNPMINNILVGIGVVIVVGLLSRKGRRQM